MVKFYNGILFSVFAKGDTSSEDIIGSTQCEHTPCYLPKNAVWINVCACQCVQQSFPQPPFRHAWGPAPSKGIPIVFKGMTTEGKEVQGETHKVTLLPYRSFSELYFSRHWRCLKPGLRNAKDTEYNLPASDIRSTWMNKVAWQVLGHAWLKKYNVSFHI